MNVRLQCFFACKVIAIAALFSQPLVADSRWWEKDPLAESVCPSSWPDDVKQNCKAGDVLAAIAYEYVPRLCDYRYSIIQRADYKLSGYASCIYLGHERVLRDTPRPKPD
jgi:hypothetical protein